MLIGRTDVVVKIENDEISSDCEIIFKDYDPDFRCSEFPVYGYGSFDSLPPSPPPPDETWLEVVKVLELPTLLSKRERDQLSLSNAVVLVAEGKVCTKVFALDPHNCQLYFVLTKEEVSFWRYAALGDNLYFLSSGHYPEHDGHIDVSSTHHIDVEAYNLNTKEWESEGGKENTINLNSLIPRPPPLVFVYDRKIYALQCGLDASFQCGLDASFQCLDPTSSAWTRLQSPPARPQGPYCCTGILHAQKGTFFLQYHAYHEESTLMFAFDLTSRQWTKIFPGDLKLYPVARLLLQIPIVTIKGACIVDNILFTYETSDCRKPEIVYYDLDDINPEPEKIDLSPILDQGYIFLTAHPGVGYLNYLGDDKFSLVIDALAGYSSFVVCCCTFELRNLPSRKQYPRVGKEPRLEKFKFSPTLCCCRAYQMPEDVIPRFCQKIQ